jgi:hypothetical protein
MSGQARTYTAAELDAMSADDYRAYIRSQTVQSAAPAVRGMSVREKSERAADVNRPEDPNREIVRSARADNMVHSVAITGSVRSRLERAATPAPKASAQTADEWLASQRQREYEMRLRKQAEDEKLRQQEEEKARIKAKADAEAQAKEQQRARGELIIAERMREQEFKLFGLDEFEIREVMARLSPEDFRDIGATKAHFYAAEIAARRS